MKRILGLDLARGFTVLFIAPIHAMMLFSNSAVKESWLGNIFRFIAEGPGAQLFMMLMGISFYLGAKKSFVQVLKRVLLLLVTGYLLNAFKFVLPASLGIMPPKLLAELSVPGGKQCLLQLFLIGDILHFAALAFFILYVITCICRHPIFHLSLAVVVCFLSGEFWDITIAHPFTNYLMVLAGGQPPAVFFPLFPWLVYPLTGYVFGYFIKDGWPLPIFFVLGLVLIAAGYVSSQYFDCNEMSFYRTCSAGTTWHTGIVIAWIAVWDWIAKHTASNLFFDLLKYLSRHITLIYVIQWMVIFWLVPVIGYEVLGMPCSVVIILFVALMTMVCVHLIVYVRRSPPHNCLNHDSSD